VVSLAQYQVWNLFGCTSIMFFCPDGMPGYVMYLSCVHCSFNVCPSCRGAANDGRKKRKRIYLADYAYSWTSHVNACELRIAYRLFIVHFFVLSFYDSDKHYITVNKANNPRVKISQAHMLDVNGCALVVTDELGDSNGVISRDLLIRSFDLV